MTMLLPSLNFIGGKDMIKYLEELKLLNLPKGKFSIFGSGPLSVRGLRENEDLDILVTYDLWNKLAEQYPITTKKDRPDSIYIGHIQILKVDYKDWRPYIIDAIRLITDAEIIENFPFVKLEYLLGCKRLMDGEKHVKDIKLIQEYIDSQK